MVDRFLPVFGAVENVAVKMLKVECIQRSSADPDSALNKNLICVLKRLL